MKNMKAATPTRRADPLPSEPITMSYTKVEWTYSKPSTSFEEIKVTYAKYLGDNGVPPDVSNYYTIMFSDLMSKRQSPTGANAVLIADFVRREPPGGPSSAYLKLGDIKGEATKIGGSKGTVKLGDIKGEATDSAMQSLSNIQNVATSRIAPLIRTDVRGLLTPGSIREIAKTGMGFGNPASGSPNI